MKQPRLTRRKFLKLGVSGTGALALASVVGVAPAAALAAVADAPAAPTAAIAGGPFYVAPAFSGIASALSFGLPADIVMGWDGVLTGIDPTGAPHLYDSISDAWQPHGEGIDAAAQVGDLLYFFKGDSFVTASQQALLQFGPVQSIASQWPTLPHAFTVNLKGAANFDGRLLLFTDGRYTSVDGSIPPTALVTLKNWPFTGQWKDGVIDGVYCASVGTTVILMRGNEFIRIDPVAGTVTNQPAPLNTLNPFNPHLPADWLATGFDTGTVAGIFQIAFRGNALVIYTAQLPSPTPAPSAPQYIPAFFTKGWPTTWHPMLIQAPSGRVGDLWAVDSANNILQHDGTNWNLRPGKVTGVSVGQDGTVYHISQVPNEQAIWRWDGTTWVDNYKTTFLMAQISVGDADHVWVRDTNNQVYRFSNGTFTPIDLGSTPVHMAANSDGTLWHCDGVAPHAYRHISEGTAASSQVAIGNGISSVHKVASTGFGLAFCLATGATVNKHGVQVAADTPQAYQYDSPFVFKTSTAYGLANLNYNWIADIATGPSCVFVVDQNSQPQAIVSLDAQTGTERWRQPLADLGAISRPHGLTYDPALQLVYCVAFGIQTKVGVLLALDAQTGQRRWTYSPGSNVGFWLPTLSHGKLCVCDTTGTVHLLDTAAALQRGLQNQAPQPDWNPLPQIPNMQTDPVEPFTLAGAPTFSTGINGDTTPVIYVTYQVQLNQANPQDPASNQPTVVTALDMASGQVLWSQSKTGLLAANARFVGVLDSVVGQSIFRDNTPEPALLVNTSGSIWALPLSNSSPVLEFTQPNGRVALDYDPTGISTNHATYEVWIKTSVKTQQMLFQTAYTQPFIFIQNDQIGVQWVDANSDPQYTWLSADTRPISDGEWHHIAVVFDNGAMTFYKDGIATADALSVNQAAGGNHPVFMGSTWDQIPSFIGQMWNVKIWRVALPGILIQADLYTSSYASPPTSLVLLSAFDVAANSVVNQIGNVAGSLTNADVTSGALPAGVTPLSRVLPNPRASVNGYFSSGLTLSGNTLYVGDNSDTLYVIDAQQLTISKQTTDTVGIPLGVRARPVVVSDSQSNSVVFFVRANNDVYLFDPASGNIDALGLEQNALNCIAYDANHGVLYGSSSIVQSNSLTPGSLGQAFGIRVAQFIQDERAFIIESQLMQDYDEPADGVSNPTTAARYQTHVSLVDSSNAALPNVSVKIWADEAVTLSIDGGAPVTVDPNATDPNQQYVAFQTDGSGSFTLHTGSLLGDGSDAPDLTAVTLRLWAGFMDVHERIVVVPDAEFHSRVSTTHATAQDPDSDDPGQVNLQNAADFPTYNNGVQQDGAPLFTSAEQNNGTPGQAASAISNTMGAIGGGSASMKQRLRAKRRALGLKDAPNKYGIDDYTLPGMVYQAANTPADRSVTPPTTLPNSFTFINSTFSSMYHTDAAYYIDALGDADAAVAGTMGADGVLAPQFNLGKSLKEGWKDIKKSAATVTHVIVSAAKDVYIGIRYVVNGIVTVVKAVVQDVADAMAAIGSFFVQLGKDIGKAIRALAAFFNFKHVIASYNVIRGVIDDYLNNLASDLKSVQVDVDAGFTTAKTDIKAGFNSLISKVEGGTPINQQPSAGSTPHSVMTVQPVPPPSARAGGRTGAGIRADGSTGGSQAVQGMWGTHKLKQNHAKSTATDGTTTDALSNFATGFADRLKGDLSSDFADVKQQFESTFKATSASQFFADALGDVLSIFEGVALLSVDVVQAFTDGLFAVVDDLVGALQNAGTIKIPVLSTLWKMITGKPLELNLIDIFAFIIAIPTTYIYRILSGTWMTSASSLSATADPQAVGATTMQNFLGVVGSIAYVLGGWVSGFLDAVVVSTDSQIPPPVMVLAKISGAGLLLLAAVQKGLGFLHFESKSGAQKAAVEFLLALSAAKAVTTIVIGPLVGKFTTPSAGVFITTLMNFLLSVLQLGFVFSAQLNQPIELTLVTVFQQIPSITGWFKLAAPLVGYIAPASDFLFLAAAGGLSLVTTIVYWHKDLPTDPAPPPTRRWYLPWISLNGPRPAQAQLTPGG